MTNAPRPGPQTPLGQAPLRSVGQASRAERLRAWLDVMFRDGGLVRLVMPNRHPVAEGVWRSGQPTPRQLRSFARAGGRSVISLRAGRGFRARALEEEVCAGLGLAFHTLPIRCHRLPCRDELRAAGDLFRTVQRPVLLHCQSGADRAGFAAALWLLLVEDRPLADARRHLSPRYGHNPLGRAGLLDAFLDAYAADTANAPVGLAEWIKRSYSPERIAADWRVTSLPTRLRRSLGWPDREGCRAS